MTNITRIPIRIIAVLFVQFDGAVANSQTPQLLSVEEIAQHILDCRREVRSVSITTRRDADVDLESGTSSSEAGKEIHFAFKGDQRFLQIRRSIVADDVEYHGLRDASLAVDLELKETRIFDGTVLTIVRGNSVAEIHAPRSDPTSRGANFDVYYMSLIGWHIFDPTATADAETMRAEMCFPEVFETYELVGAVRDEKSDQDCLLLRGEFAIDAELDREGVTRRYSDQIWLSSEFGYSIVRRETSEFGKDESYAILATAPVEVSPGCFVPTNCIVTKRKGDVEVSRIVLSVTNVVANQVDDDQFTAVVPKTAIVINKAAKARNGRPLDRPLVTMPEASISRMDQISDAIALQNSNSNRSWLLLSVNFLVFILLTLAYLLRLKNKSM